MPTYGSFTDSRDGNTYRTIKIGDQTWMAENLRFKPKIEYIDTNSSLIKSLKAEGIKTETVHIPSYSIDDDPAYDKKYGILYVSGEPEYAPKGWRIPTKEDVFKLLENATKIEEDFSRFRALGCRHSDDFIKHVYTSGYRCNEIDKSIYFDDSLEKLGFSRFPAAGYKELDTKTKDCMFLDSISTFWVCSGYVLQLDEFGAILFEKLYNDDDMAYSIRCIKK